MAVCQASPWHMPKTNISYQKHAITLPANEVKLIGTAFGLASTNCRGGR